jgi:hypothetical protein
MPLRLGGIFLYRCSLKVEADSLKVEATYLLTAHPMKPMKNKIVIFVDGGNVQWVMSSNRNTVVEVIDRDNLCEDGEGWPEAQLQLHIDNTTKGLKDVY